MKKIIPFLIIVLILFTSCFMEPDSKNTDTKGITTSGLSVGKVTIGSYESFQLFGLVQNKSSETKELIEYKVDWLDSSDTVLLSENKIVARLEPGQSIPIWCYHDDVKEMSILEEFTHVRITFTSAYKDQGLYSTSFAFTDISFYTVGGVSKVSGTLTNNSKYPLSQICIEASALNSSGKCFDYAIDYMPEMTMAAGQSISFTLTLEQGATNVFYCSGTR